MPGSSNDFPDPSERRLRPYQTVRAKVLLYFFVPALVILGAVAALLPLVNQRTAESLAGERNGEIARLLADQAFNELLTYVTVLDGVASRPEVYGFEPAAQQLALRTFVGRLRSFDSGVVILDLNGRITAGDARRFAARGQDWSSHDFVRRALQAEGPAVISDIVSLSPGDDVVALALPVRAPGQGYRGLIVGLFGASLSSPSDLRSAFARLPAGERRLVMVDGAGRIVYSTERGETGARLPWDISSVDVGKAIRRTGDSGGDVLTAIAAIPETGWRLILEEPWAGLAAAYRGSSGLLTGLLFLGLLAPALVVGLGVDRITRPIAALTAAVRGAAGGNLGSRVEVHTGDELELLAEQFNDTSARLAESYADLERKVAERTAELNTLYEQAKETAALAERSRLARELHDSVTQTIFSAKLVADVLPRLWERHPDVAREKLEELRLLTAGALAEMRTLLVELRPTALSEGDLGELLRNLGGSAQARGRLTVTVQTASAVRLSAEVQEVFYRVAQEALNNTVKHANATRVTVCFLAEETLATPHARLEISDDGAGFDPATAAGGCHFGLRIMGERAQSIDASLDIKSGPGEGTTVLLTWHAIR